MLTFKQSVAGGVVPFGPVVNSSGTPITGIAFGSVTVKIGKADGSAAGDKTMTSPDWVEKGLGVYHLILSNTDVDTLGSGEAILTYDSATAAVPFQVVANIEADTFVRLGAPAGASVSADIAAIFARTDVATSTRLASGTVAADLATLTTSVAALDTLLKQLDDNSLTRMTVLTRDGSNRPLTAQVYRWDTPANFTANGATGRVEYLVTCTYHASGTVDTFSKARV